MRVQIPKPCTENWELMSPQDKGRQKLVMSGKGI